MKEATCQPMLTKQHRAGLLLVTANVYLVDIKSDVRTDIIDLFVQKGKRELATKMIRRKMQSLADEMQQRKDNNEYMLLAERAYKKLVRAIALINEN